MPLRICNNGVSILNADRIAEPVQCTSGVEKVSEFPITIKINGMKNDVVMDVLLICAEPLEPMSLVRAYPIGVITMMDNGRADEKIIAIPFNDPNYNMYSDIDQLPKHIFDEMKHFFTVYKNLEHKDTAVDEVRPKEIARRVIEDAINNYVEKFCK